MTVSASPDLEAETFILLSGLTAVSQHPPEETVLDIILLKERSNHWGRGPVSTWIF